MSNLTLIAAYGKNRAIGKAGTIPWHYAEDFAHFKRETLGSTLIMGRSTWDSIGRPLPGRITVVLTRDLEWTAPGHEESVVVAHDLEEALWLSSSLPGKTFIAGGGQVYAEAFPLATHQILTEIPQTVEHADAFYPSFSEADWREDRTSASNGLRYRWLSKIA